jgi:two-component system sensor histidine kinase AtoS
VGTTFAISTVLVEGCVAPLGFVPMTKSPRRLLSRSSKRLPSVPSPAHDDAFFRHIVSGMRNGVLAITRDGSLALINEEAYRIFGVTAQRSDLGRPVADVLGGHPEIVRVLTTVFDLHLLPNRVELRLRPSGKVIGYTLAIVRDDEGAVVGAAMFFKDLTRVEQLEERERLRDRLAAVGEMAAAIAHEVKNPLAGIEVMAGLLRRRIPDSREAQTVLADIINEAKMANAIVQEVLEFVRPMRLHMEHTGVADAVQSAVQLADTQARRGEIHVKVQVPQALPHIQGDQHQLAQLFTNLLANAYEAMAGRGHVVISARTVRMDNDEREAVQVEVADDGPGMPPDVADHIFDPFFTTKAQGSGLGLAIVRKIVDAHDGTIDLKTVPGAGTTIRVTLPTRALADGTD